MAILSFIINSSKSRQELRYKRRARKTKLSLYGNPMIEIIQNNIECKIVGLSNVNIIEQIDQVLSYHMTGYRFTPSFRAGRWDGRNRLLQKRGPDYYFLSGLLPKVEAILKSNYQEYTIYDERKEIKFGKKIKIKNIEPREYQKQSLAAAISHKSGVISIPTGGGKTIVIAEIVAHFNVPTMIFVPGIDLLYQTKSALENFLCNTKVGMIGDGVVNVRKITVCTIWSCINALGKKYEKHGEDDTTKAEKFNIKNKKKVRDAINNACLFITDECQFLGTSTLQHINKASYNAKFKFGFSATVEREDNANLLIEGVCGSKIVDITASELIQDGFLVQPIIHLTSVPKMDGINDNYQSVYKNYIVENEDRNDKIIMAANKLASQGRKVLILIKNIRHGEILLEKFGPDSVIHFVRGELSSDERNKIKESFICDDFQILIASSVYDQGIDIPMLDSLILACGGKSVGKLFQRIGRVIRPYPNKKDAIIVDFIDNAPHLLRHSAKRIEVYRTEPGFKIKLPKKGSKDGSKKSKKAQTKRLSSDHEGW